MMGVLSALWRIVRDRSLGPRQIEIRASVRPKVYPLILELADDAAAAGLHRWYKHRDDAPDEATLMDMRDAVADAIVTAVCERFTWDDGEGSE